jgi:cell division protein FtsI/penicillin-binding protein 2
MTPGITHAARIRAYLAAAVVTAGLCGVAWRAWALQVEDGDRYRALATKQHELTVAIPAPRGDIIDARGRPLAVSAAADSIWANPREIRDVTSTAERLARLLSTDAITLESKLGGDRRFVWLDRHVAPELARAVRDARLPGIEVSKEPRRWYPARAIGGVVIGKSDIDGNGVGGVELAMNAQLVGRRGAGLALRDVRGKRMFADGIDQPEPGATVQLSLDITIQAIAESALADGVRANKAKTGVAVVLEIATGRVLAMASSPSSDPNASGGAALGSPRPGPLAPDSLGNESLASTLPPGSGVPPDSAGDGSATPSLASLASLASGEAAAEQMRRAEGELGRPRATAGARNRAVTDAYEAGSVMKIFSIAAALDDGTVSPDTEFDLGGGTVQIGGRPIHDVDRDRSLTVAGIIKRSSNIGAAKIALRFGAAKLYAALRRFGFGARTGIELPREAAGTLRDGAHWRDIELATISYGYGLAVTPLQIAAALAAFGNHGVYREPRIVDRVIDADGTLLYEAAPAERRVVSDTTASAMLAMLATVFESGKQAGTAGTIVVPGFRCAGKTGTARKLDLETKKYVPGHYLSSFAGIAPFEHPRLAVVVMIDDPSEGDYFGAKVAGPVFAAIASNALRYLGVPGGPTTCAPAVPGAPPSTAAKTCLPPGARFSDGAPHGSHPGAGSP